jgi:hypothetical protein
MGLKNETAEACRRGMTPVGRDNDGVTSHVTQRPRLASVEQLISLHVTELALHKQRIQWHHLSYQSSHDHSWLMKRYAALLLNGASLCRAFAARSRSFV